MWVLLRESDWNAGYGSRPTGQENTKKYCCYYFQPELLIPFSIEFIKATKNFKY